MAKCLIALGSNVGERTATLDAAVAALDAADGVRVERASAWHVTLPVGSPKLDREFLNGAAVAETSHEPEVLLKLLREIEAAHGRERRERWSDRTLDLDLLLYGELVVGAPELTVPHPRMSFRRFVLEPAVEIAADWVHPTIGWTLEQLLEQLDDGADCVAILSPAVATRRRVVNQLVGQFAAEALDAPLDEPKWPTKYTSWLRIGVGETPPQNRLPKLTIVIDPVKGGDNLWQSLAGLPSRGPTLRISASPAERVGEDIFAAIESVWPHLGQRGR